MVSIRGFPDHNIIRYLGRQFNVDPHVLLSHLPYPPSFVIRSMPSMPNPAVNVLLISLGYHPPENPMYLKQAIMDENTKSYNRILFNNKMSRYQQCHSVNRHGSQFFSVEQKASLVISTDHGSPFSAILLSNCGDEYSEMPWKQTSRNEVPPRFLPLRPFGTLPLSPAYLRDTESTTKAFKEQHPDPFQSRILHGDTMSKTEQELCLQDPILLATDLFKTSALTWRQFFSFLKANHESPANDDPAVKADRLHREKQILDRACYYFEDVISMLEYRHMLGWPTCPLEKDREKVDFIVAQVKQDYEYLGREAIRLAAECASSISLEMNRISIDDAKQSIQQAERVRLLTFLAYLFLQLSFVASLFGMNVAQITTPNPSIWLYFAIACPVTLVCALVPVWQDVLGYVLELWKPLPLLFRSSSIPH